METTNETINAIKTKIIKLRKSVGELSTQLADIETTLERNTTPTPPAIKLTATTATADSITIKWDDVPGVSRYPVHRSGIDTTGAGPWTGVAEGNSHTFTKLKPSTTYTMTVTAWDTIGGQPITTGVIKATTTSEAKPNPPTTKPRPAEAEKSFRRIGKSGLKADSLVFLGGEPNLTSMDQFASDRGTPIDGALTFPGRETWDQLKSGLPAAKRLVDAGYRVVYSMPHAPISEGDQMNARGANNAYAEQQRSFGTALRIMGLNNDSFVLRVDWEFNGYWYPWSANRPGGAEALKDSLRNFRKNVRAGAGGNNIFDLCCNKLPSQSKVTWADVMDHDDPFDVLGVDQYDQWGPSFSLQQWNTEARKGIALADEQAQRFGVRWSLDETGNTHPKDANHGGDNPNFWAFISSEIAARADRCAWWVTYEHDGAPDTLRHQLRVHNPIAWSSYKNVVPKILGQ